MTTWHCPVCGLDFAFHSELDWHIREAHLPEADSGSGRPAGETGCARLGRAAAVAVGRRGPSVSLLLWTTPAAVMTAADAADLHQLAASAVERTGRRDLRGEARRHIEARLAEAVRAAENSPTDHGLAVFVSPTETAVVPLPFSPRERAVVNHTFATRDLLDALQTFPMYRALVLRGPGFRLLEGRGERLS